MIRPTRLARIFTRAPLAWAVAGSLALHAAALAAIHFGWQVDAPAPVAPQAFAVVTIDAPETDAPGESEAAAAAPEPAPPSPQPAEAPAADEAPAATNESPPATTLSRAIDAPPPVPAPAPAPAPSASPSSRPVPVFEAPPRKPAPPMETEATESRDVAKAPTEAPPAQTAARSPAPPTAGTGRATPPAYGLPGLANPPPRYPWSARRKGEEGRVVLRVQVDETGAAARVDIARSSGHGRLDRAALAAIKQWQFRPARKGGRAVAGTVNVPVTFRLNDR